MVVPGTWQNPGLPLVLERNVGCALDMAISWNQKSEEIQVEPCFRADESRVKQKPVVPAEGAGTETGTETGRTG